MGCVYFHKTTSFIDLALQPTSYDKVDHLKHHALIGNLIIGNYYAGHNSKKPVLLLPNRLHF